VAAWQSRPLEAIYPLVFFDALRVKICDEGLARNKAVHIALGVRADGTKEILGLWIEQNEGAKFWLRVMNELKNRGVDDQLRGHLADFISAYNFDRRLKTLKGLAPYEHICQEWTKQPDRFILHPTHQMPGSKHLAIVPLHRDYASLAMSG
jgi:hypothetical protein